MKNIPHLEQMPILLWFFTPVILIASIFFFRVPPVQACSCLVSSTDSTVVTVSADASCQSACGDTSATETGTYGSCTCADSSITIVSCTDLCDAGGYYYISDDQYCFLYIADGSCSSSNFSSTIYGTSCDALYLGSSVLYYGIYDDYAPITSTVGGSYAI